MQTQKNKLDFKDQNIYIGLDVHKNSWKVTVMAEKIVYKTFSQDPNPEVLYQYLQNNFPGATYHSAYEAGFSGYWIHNKLKSLGIKSMVVNPADIPTTHKEKIQKEDARDSRKIARSLQSGDLTAIYVPNLKTLEDRGLIRMRSALVKDLTRNRNRIKSFLYFHGIDIDKSFSGNHTRWSGRFVKWLEELNLQQPSAKQTLDALIVASKNLRTSVLEITRKIQQLSKTESYCENVLLMQSVPGIGLLTAMMILTAERMKLLVILLQEDIRCCGVPSLKVRGLPYAMTRHC
jgi:transposase